jgi:ubiquinone/menaquinone biosynthesis C-methylase UbiE
MSSTTSTVPHPSFTGLKSLDYEQAYYEEHVAGGLDYLGHGYWQESYGHMVSEATLQADYEDPMMLDAGCAAGSILTGFKKTGVYRSVKGVDLSNHMIQIGRKHFGMSDEEMVAGSIAELPIESGSLSLVHSAQVLEHIPTELMDQIVSEFVRVLRPGGRLFLCLDAIRKGETKEMYMGDPTHVNIQPVMYWTKMLQQKGLLFDIEAYNAFVRSERGPTRGLSDNFFQHYPFWSAWTLIKPV